jgi:membrane-bound inhibitor of C-type lysozyme
MTGHLRTAALLALSATLAGAALVQANVVPQATGPAPTTSRTVPYTCAAGQKISVTSLKYGADGPTFAVLNWNGGQYGLAPALSASGARYVALAGPVGARGGLEWWEHAGAATLSTFVDGGTLKTRALLTGCRAG